MSGTGVPHARRGGPGGAGVTLSQAAAGLARRGHRSRPVRRVTALFRPYRRQVIGVGLLILVTAGLGVASPLLIREVFDKALFAPGGVRVRLLIGLCTAMIAIPAIASALGVWQSYLTNFVGQQVMRDLRGRLFSHLQSLSMRFFTGTRTGEIQLRLQNDVGGLQTVITDTASTPAQQLGDPGVHAGRADHPVLAADLALAGDAPAVHLADRPSRPDPASDHRADPGRAHRDERDHSRVAVGLGSAAGQGVRPTGPGRRALPRAERSAGPAAGLSADRRPGLLCRRLHLLLDHPGARLPGGRAATGQRPRPVGRHDHRLHHPAGSAVHADRSAAPDLHRNLQQPGPFPARVCLPRPAPGNRRPTRPGPARPG